VVLGGQPKRSGVTRQPKRSVEHTSVLCVDGVNDVGECYDTYSAPTPTFSADEVLGVESGKTKGEGGLPLRIDRVSRSAICFLWREPVAYCNG
jgi:hypothetical protein